ncbi:hypothetical protein CEUSTIGMA_g2034.t1 [Chlamydomonas eustigma]|uniref:Globin family profile domain-containing protein n=1 Tax=Chlamydomonas eustigma TaxID=1157962 RepID=A0A250WV04_9CHLO|nr:hypothetical protein CEUSTIGMA_g2034.t1 [Chlamydomonas eustigma]|eukprot:GAX74586.1 hypothetical protein CEUSTIGMA_g2034.t1 [Chlamydomonas eustigma]
MGCESSTMIKSADEVVPTASPRVGQAEDETNMATCSAEGVPSQITQPSCDLDANSYPASDSFHPRETPVSDVEDIMRLSTQKESEYPFPDHPVHQRHDTIYKRLGGSSKIEAIVNILYEKIMEDKKLLPFFQEVSLEYIKSHQVAFLGMAFDGPNPHKRFNVDIMVLAHARLIREKGLEQTHFDLFIQHFLSSLQHLNVPQLLINEMMTVVGPLRLAFASPKQSEELDMLAAF